MWRMRHVVEAFFARIFLRKRTFCGWLLWIFPGNERFVEVFGGLLD